jgi:hypothetical protein
MKDDYTSFVYFLHIYILFLYACGILNLDLDPQICFTSLIRVWTYSFGGVLYAKISLKGVPV